MKRGSSATSLHNLANSIKNSIMKDISKSKSKTTLPITHIINNQKNNNYAYNNNYNENGLTLQKRLAIGRTKSVTNFNNQGKTYNNNNLFFTPLQQTINAQKDIAINENCLKKNDIKSQIQKLQKQIQQLSQNDGKSVVRSYNKELQLYDQATKIFKMIEKQYLKKKQQIYQINNRIRMIKQDLSSRQFNTIQILAQKQYYQEILQAYQNQYQSQSEVVLQMIKLLHNNAKLNQQIKKNQNKVDILNKQLQQWKQQYHYQFNTKKNKGKITQARVQLLGIQQKADQFAKQKCCQKIRQLLCIFIKNYTIQNMKITRKCDLQQGLQFYICKQRLSFKLKQFLLQKNRDKPIYQEMITNYCKVLHKMQNIISNRQKQGSNKIVDGYNIQIQQINACNVIYQQQVNNNKQRIQELKNKLDIIFGNQNVVLIQIMKQKTGKIQLDSIKNKLKDMANQQQKRVQKIKQIYIKSQNIKIDRQYYQNQSIIQELRSLTKQKQNKTIEIQKSLLKVKKAQQQKIRLQQKLSDAVASWKQHSNKKKKLKKLYKQLDKYQKQKIKCFQNQKKSKRELQKNLQPITKILSSQMSLSSKLMNRTATTTIISHKNISNNQNQNTFNQSKKSKLKIDKKSTISGFNTNQNQTLTNNNNQLKIYRKKSSSTFTKPLLNILNTHSNKVSVNGTIKKSDKKNDCINLKKSWLTSKSRANSEKGQLTNLLLSKFTK